MYFNQKEELTGKKPQKASAAFRSNDGEQLLAKVRPRTRREGSELPNALPSSYRVDDKGITNNYAILPAMSWVEYSSPEQQWRYAFQGAVGILFLALTLLTALVLN